MKNVYVIKDRISGVYYAPHTSHNEESMKRDIQLSADPETMLYRYPQDFELYYVGFYDEVTGIIVAEQKVYLCTIEEILDGK